METNYAREKLNAAVRIMATGPGGIKDRLRHAFEEFHTLQAANFATKGLQDAYDEICTALQTLDGMDEGEAIRIADLIWDLKRGVE